MVWSRHGLREGEPGQGSSSRRPFCRRRRDLTDRPRSRRSTRMRPVDGRDRPPCCARPSTRPCRSSTWQKPKKINLTHEQWADLMSADKAVEDKSAAMVEYVLAADRCRQPASPRRRVAQEWTRSWSAVDSLCRSPGKTSRRRGGVRGAGTGGRDRHARWWFMDPNGEGGDRSSRRAR